MFSRLFSLFSRYFNKIHFRQQNQEIRFNLMAVVPDRILVIRERVDLMRNNLIKMVGIINECEALCQEEEQMNKSKQSTLNKHFEKNEPLLNETFSSNSPSSSIDSISSLVTEPNKPLSDSLESNMRQLRSANISNKMLINNNKENAKFSSRNKQDTCDEVEIIFCLNSNDLIDDLIKNTQSDVKVIDMNNNNNSKIKLELNRILEKLDLIDLNKLFKIEFVKTCKSKTKIFKKNEDDCENSDAKSYFDSPNNFHEFKVESQNSSNIDDDFKFYRRISNLDELKSIETKLEYEIEADESKCNEEMEKKNKYKVKLISIKIFLSGAFA